MLTFFTGTMVRRGAKEQEGAAQTENPGTKFPIPNQNDICLEALYSIHNCEALISGSNAHSNCDLIDLMLF